ncbi:right-handed parallel beta-helix repeat-containing protein [Mycobacterium sp. B14F4]|uniref:right-handed parallel beta-helix repeat-containing protein n=1 Tax=Mycobacterium sp. B14F4 TaxID=3153565 RepID=UPI00325C42E7
MKKFGAVGAAIACVLAVLTFDGAPAATAVPVAGDNTAALQARFDQLRPGDTLNLEPGTYQHGGMLYIRASGVQINGNGATLEATNPGTAALVIHGDNVALSNLNLIAPVGLPRQDGTNQTMLVFGGTGVTVSGVNITGGSSAGMYVPNASNFRIENVTIRDTAADGIQLTAGSNNGQVNNVTTEGTGDDGIAVVSHTFGPAVGMCHDIVINSPRVLSNRQARGLVVVGGERITFNDINVSNTSAAGVFIGSQATFATGSVRGVTVNGGVITAANFTAFPMGAVTVYSGTPGQTVADVTVSNLAITDTQPVAGQNIGVGTAGGTLSNINFRDIAIQQAGDLPVLKTLDAPRETYTATGITLNGAPYTAP